MEGKYTYTQDDGLTGTMTLWPSCVPTVGDLREPLELPVACRLHVEAVPSNKIRGGDAYQTNGQWVYNVSAKDGMECPDGSTAPIRESYEINSDTLTGTRTAFHNDDCGLQPGMTKMGFRLAFKEPLPIPVDRYPLNCEPAGLRICA